MTTLQEALELVHVSKAFGNVIALNDVSLKVAPGTVTCVLGDNGAGKSTLIKILSGVHKPTGGEFLVEGEHAEFSSPRDALSRGIATVFQDLATVPLMAIWRNFFLGNEPKKGLNTGGTGGREMVGGVQGALHAKLEMMSDQELQQVIGSTQSPSLKAMAQQVLAEHQVRQDHHKG